VTTWSPQPNFIFYLIKEPVDTSIPGLESYARVIRKPMCINQIIDNLKMFRYLYLAEMQRDIELIYDNCASFNDEVL